MYDENRFLRFARTSSSDDHASDESLGRLLNGDFHFPNSNEDFKDEDPRREAYRLQQEQERMNSDRFESALRTAPEDANKSQMPGGFAQISALACEDVDPNRADDAFGAALKPPEQDKDRDARETYRGDGAELDLRVPAHWQRALPLVRQKYASLVDSPKSLIRNLKCHNFTIVIIV